MDSSLYYYNGFQDEDSPTLSPLSATFDSYPGDDLSFFNTTPNGPFPGLSPSVAFSMTPRTSSLGQSTSTYPLGYPHTEESLQDPYLNDPLRLMRNTSNSATYPAQPSAGDDSPQLQSPSTLDSTMYFLQSPHEADDSTYFTSPEAFSDKRNEKRKRGSQQSSKSTPSKATTRSPTDDTHAAQRSSTTQLRTASRVQRAQQISSHARKGTPAVASEEVRARATHNHVEQQYRKRLNTQFQKLLAVLPPAECEGKDPVSDGDDPKAGGAQKRISKAEVLDLARRRIKTLESERAVLERQKRELASCVGRLQDEWARRLGGDVPIKLEG